MVDRVRLFWFRDCGNGLCPILPQDPQGVNVIRTIVTILLPPLPQLSVHAFINRLRLLFVLLRVMLLLPRLPVFGLSVTDLVVTAVYK